MFIDAKGKPCPMPLVMTKKAFDGGEKEVEIIVDNETASLNLKKFAASENLNYEVNKEGELYRCRLYGEFTAKQSEEDVVAICDIDSGKTDDYVVFLASETLGHGSEELGKNLIKMAIYTLSQSDKLPHAILFMNGGVKLPCSDVEQIITSLEDMKNKGVKLLVCGACLDFFGIKEELKVGEVSNMYNILSEMQSAKKVVKL